MLALGMVIILTKPAQISRSNCEWKADVWWFIYKEIIRKKCRLTIFQGTKSFYKSEKIIQKENFEKQKNAYTHYHIGLTRLSLNAINQAIVCGELSTWSLQSKIRKENPYQQ